MAVTLTVEITVGTANEAVVQLNEIASEIEEGKWGGEGWDMTTEEPEDFSGATEGDR